MRKILDLLDSRERRVLGLLIGLVVAALLFHVLFALGEKRSHFHLESSLSAGENNLQEILTGKLAKSKEWERWKEAGIDMEQLRKDRFYEEKGNINRLRKDLHKVLREAGVRVSQISYNYHLFEEEGIKRVTMSFRASGSYLSMKRLFHAVENHTRFLVIERVDFSEIDAERGRLELRMELAGYYAL
jgi:Tfp pilus assembly protein PilO